MFFTYHRTDKYYELVKQVSIAGVLGAHISAVADRLKLQKHDSMPWSLSGQDLCCAVEDASSCTVIADATYGRADSLILKINHI